MMRSRFWIMATGLLGLGFAGHAAAEGSPIAASMGDLRWGLNEREVASYAERTLTEHYNAEIARTKDSSKKAQLRAQLKGALAEVDRAPVSFEGGHSRWDHSPVAGEFSYDNGESMLTAKDVNAEVYYFFLNGQLWKVCKVLDKSAAAGGDFNKFSKFVESKFGKGRLKKGEVTPGQGNTQWLEYLDRNSRLRAVGNTNKRGPSLIYEQMAAVRELASTHRTKPSRLAGMSEDEDSEVKNLVATKQGDDGRIAKASTKQRSVFGNEHHEETDAEYQARRQKTIAEERERAQREHARKEDAKKGEVLKQLDGLNDSDPLGGL